MTKLGSRKLHIRPKVTKMGSIIGHKLTQVPLPPLVDGTAKLEKKIRFQTKTDTCEPNLRSGVLLPFLSGKRGEINAFIVSLSPKKKNRVIAAWSGRRAISCQNIACVHFFALVSFLARPKPKIPFLGLSLLRN